MSGYFFLPPDVDNDSFDNPIAKWALRILGAWVLFWVMFLALGIMINLYEAI